MWAHVRFICDSKKVNVPTRYIKYDGDLVVKKNYPVFWSPNEDETPDDIFQKQGKVLEIENLVEDKRKKNANPMAGYYKATVLQLANSEEELIKKIDEGSRIRLNRRPLSPVSNDASSSNTQKMEKRKKIDADQFNLNSSLSILDKAESSEAYRDLKTRYKKLETKYNRLKIEAKDLRELNVYLQKQLYSRSYAKETVQTASPDIQDITPLDPVIASSVLTPTTLQKQLFPRSYVKDTVQTVSPVIQDVSSLDPVISSSVLAPTIPPMEPLTSTPLPPTNDTVELDFVTDVKFPTADPALPETSEIAVKVLDESKLQLAAKVKNGEAGDSLYAKNLATVIWGKAELASRSVCGQKCNAKKESLARKALTPEKLNVLKSLFHQRIKEENGVSKEETERRLSKINKYICDKIITLNRAIKTSESV